MTFLCSWGLSPALALAPGPRPALHVNLASYPASRPRLRPSPPPPPLSPALLALTLALTPFTLALTTSSDVALLRAAARVSVVSIAAAAPRVSGSHIIRSLASSGAAASSTTPSGAAASVLAAEEATAPLRASARLVCKPLVSRRKSRQLLAQLLEQVAAPPPHPHHVHPSPLTFTSTPTLNLTSTSTVTFSLTVLASSRRQAQT